MVDWIKRERTWARQFSFLMWLGLALLIYEDKKDELEILIWPVTVFSLAAFGFKQPSVDSWMRK